MQNVYNQPVLQLLTEAITKWNKNGDSNLPFSRLCRYVASIVVWLPLTGMQINELGMNIAA